MSDTGCQRGIRIFCEQGKSGRNSYRRTDTGYLSKEGQKLGKSWRHVVMLGYKEIVRRIYGEKEKRPKASDEKSNRIPRRFMII